MAPEQVEHQKAGVGEPVGKEQDSHPRGSQRQPGELGMMSMEVEPFLPHPFPHKITDPGGGGNESRKGEDIGRPVNSKLVWGQLDPGFDKSFGVSNQAMGMG